MEYVKSPLNDRIYLLQITIELEHRRQGYAWSALCLLARNHQLPITPVREMWSEFWVNARARKAPHLELTCQLSTEDIDRERMRWAYQLDPPAAR